MKKKVGVITLYYKNYNYGGLLQAYALVEKLRKMGVDAKQISFDRTYDESPLLPTRAEKLRKKPISFCVAAVKRRICNLLENIKNKNKQDSIKNQIILRNNAFLKFQNSIPHTEIVSCNNIRKINKSFDAFICGSDQVWNPSQLTSAYLLDFAEQEKTKISYAASIGRDYIEEEKVQYFVNRLHSFDFISVRESYAQQVLNARLDNVVECVLDPTLLLSNQEWDEIAEPYEINEKYVLTYFLGDDKEQRDVAISFAKEKQLRLLGFPNILGKYRENDENIEGYDLYDVSPNQFIYLIKNAEYIITDSFHACVFSIIYNKRFIALERQFNDSAQKMNSRLITLLELFDLSDRFITPDKISVIEKEIKRNDIEFQKQKEKSINFLKKALSL